MEQETETDWAINEFGAADLGDARRTARLLALARQLAKSPHCSFPQSLSQAELKAAYRFFDNEDVDIDGILTAHVGQTLARLRDVPVVLAVQDTTEYNLTHLPATEALGYCSDKRVKGFLMHSMLAITPEGLPLGVMGMKGLNEIEVQAIWAIESAPPEGQDAVEWMLLISVPTANMDEALERLAWYARRWTIETWHRVLKSGCQIEARQFGDVERFMRATALFAVIAWRILYATLLGRLDADISCEVLLQRFEWQALYCRAHGTTKVPKKPPTLGNAILWIAKLGGGYLGRTNDRPPGTTAMWRGFLALHESAQMFLIFQRNE